MELWRTRTAMEPWRSVEEGAREDWLVAGGEVAAVLRAMDWSGTPLGPREEWPGALRTVVNLLLATRVPMALAWGRELTFLYNDALRELAPERHPWALGRSVRDVWPELWPRTEPAYAAVTSRGQTVSVEHAQFTVERGRKAEDAYFTISYSPVWREDGTVGGALVAIQETTAALRASEEKFRSVFEHAAVGMSRAGFVDGQLIDVNDAFCRMLGRSRDELIRTPWTELTHPEDLERDLAPFRRMAAGELDSYTVEKRFLHRDGHDVWARLTLSLVRDPAGTPAYEIAIIEDIGDRKRAEQALRASEQRLRMLVDHVPAAVAILDREMRYLAVSRRYLADLRMPAEDVTGRCHYDLFPEVPERWRAIHRRCLAGAVESAEEDPFPRADGTIDWLRWEVHPWRAEDGGVGGIVILAEVITDRKRTQDALRESEALHRKLAADLRDADRRKNEFLGMLSHELRNPLAPIRNALYILDRVDPTSAQAGHAREVAGRQVGHLTRLVDDLLDVTRIARGKIELRRVDLDLGALARRAAEDHRAMLQARGLELSLSVPGDPVVVRGDETRLAQVFGNLLTNAAKFTPAGGRVSLEVGADGGRTIVHVRDTGPGIAPDVMPSLFQPFAQGRQTLARSEGGLGLGLALAKGLVSLHGGEIAVANEGGAVFTITLPLADARPARAPASERRRPAGGEPRRRVLVVDDNHDAAESLAELVSMLGHEVEIAYDGPSALAKADRHAPDLVLCDIGLPGMDGYAVARQLRAAGAPGPRLVALSGYAQPDDVARAIESGFDAHVAKPPDPERLASIIGLRPGRRASDAPGAPAP